MYTFIDSEKALSALCKELIEYPWIALDTEFIREKTYYPQLCLIQIATRDSIACIDPLRLGSLSPLFEILYSQRTTKILHSAYQDLEIFYYLSGIVPSPVFDTQIAAGILGYGDQIGYAALVEQILHITLDKSHSRTRWNRRPLDSEQLQYAVNDVKYLQRLYPELTGKLNAKEQMEWLIEDCNALCKEQNFKISLPYAWQRVRGANKLNLPQLVVLQALASWREHQAMTQNLPRRWILSDPALLTLTRNAPHDLQTMAETKSVSRKFAQKHGEELIDIIKNAQAIPKAQWPHLSLPHHRQLSPQQKDQLIRLTALIKHYASIHHLSPSTLATRSQLVKLIMGESEIPVMTGWRAALVGNELLSELEKTTLKPDYGHKNNRV